MGGPVKVVVAALQPGFAPEEVTAGLGPENPPVGFLEESVHAGVANGDADGVAAGSVDGLAYLVEAGKRCLLCRRADPLDKARAVVPAGVPRAWAHSNLAVATVAVEVVVDEAGMNALASVVPCPPQQVLVKHGPEVGFWWGVADPAAVLSIGAGGHKGREVAVPGPLGHLVNEPVSLHPRLLGVGELTVAYHDDDVFAPEPGNVRTVAEFVPAHGGDRFDVLTVDQHVAVVLTFESGDELHAKAHLRGPEPGEASSRKKVLTDPLPAGDLLVTVSPGNEGEDGMVVARAQDADDLGVLQVPQQRSAVHDPVDAALEVGTGQGLEQSARNRQVHPANILIGPQRAGYSVHGPEDLSGFPLLPLKEVLKVVSGLMQVEHQGKGCVSHRGSLPVTGRGTRSRWCAGPVRRRSRSRCPRPSSGSS